MSPVIEIAVSHRLDAFTLDATFVSEGRLTALSGPSGAGKTSLVNIIAGLMRPDHGRVVVDGEVLLDTRAGIVVPSHRRRIGYVFQDARLFPHLNVRQNLLFGRWFAQPNARSTSDLAGVLDLLGIGDLLERRPGSLSGGERQRVAIGRALLAKPRLLLMDEPLASLDEARKAEILPYVERLRDEAGVPIIYVSHAPAEVARLANTLVTLEQGRITACGPTSSVMSHADSAGPSRPDPAATVLDARILGHDDVYRLTTLSTRAGPLQVPRIALPEGAALTARIRPDDVMISLTRPVGISALNILPGRIVAIGHPGAGSPAELRIDCGGECLLARLETKSVDGLDLREGSAILAIIANVSVSAP